MKTCPKCTKNLPITQFPKSKQKRSGIYPYCKKCCVIKQQNYRILNKEQEQKRDKQRHKETKLMVLKHYGNKCKCCGETQYEFLSIDHINNDGAKHRKQIAQEGGIRDICVWIIKHNFPNFLQILCYNCNCAKQFAGYCPHTLQTN